MIVKAIGIFLVLFSTTSIGFFLSGRMKERIEELETIRRLLLMLRGEIKYSHSTLAEAFQTIGRRLKEPYGAMLLKTASVMEQLKGQTLAQIWEESIREALRESALYGEDKEKLIQMGNQLGYLDTEMQLSTIELYLEQIEEEIKNAWESFKRNGKLCRTMGIIAGIFLVILMV